MRRSIHGRAAVVLCGLLAGFAATAGAAEPGTLPQPHARPEAAGPVPAAGERQRLLDEGEAQLAAGDAAAAQQTFERAAMLAHAADTEAALVRALMQAGAYRRALAFGAHAGAHDELPAATALYAHLLDVGGQGRVAAQVLERALARHPDDASLRWARDALAGAAAAVQAPEHPVRMAPYETPAGLGAGARVVASAVLAGDGIHALAPTRALDGADRLWLRNGLGQTVAAERDRSDAATGLTLLRLRSPLPPAATLRSATRAPFAGSAGTLVEYATGTGPAWPRLRFGFFARLPASAAAPRPLGIEAPPGPRGGPVFDAAGRLAGIALADIDGKDRLLAVDEAAALGLGAGLAWPPAEAAVAAAPAAFDGVYENALRVALQVLVTP